MHCSYQRLLKNILLLVAEIIADIASLHFLQLRFPNVWTNMF